VETDGKVRTEDYARASHSDAQGSQVNTHQGAHQVNADGTNSGHESNLSSSTNNTLGYTQDEHHINVTGTNVSRQFPATGQDVAVSGQGCHLTFLGQTHGLSITGNDNQIEVENATLIDVSGARNKVQYTGAPPEIKQSGEGNSLQPKAPVN
jgi:hypothetical protein